MVSGLITSLKLMAKIVQKKRGNQDGYLSKTNNYENPLNKAEKIINLSLLLFTAKISQKIALSTKKVKKMLLRNVKY